MSQPFPTPELSLVHLVRSPRTDFAGKPPLLILLHGIGSNERDLFAFAEKLDPRFLVLSVRAPLLVGPDNFAWFHVEHRPEGFVVNTDELEVSHLTFVMFLGEAIEAYQADPERVYLMGFSQGANMSLAVALAHPELVAGAVALSGRVLPEVIPWFAPGDELAGLPLLLEHGTDDAVIPIRYAREARNVLEDLPVDLTYQEYEMGHEVTPQSLDDALVWLTTRLNSPRRAK
jgi:phospholipase/carboxylesterase